MTGFDLPTNYVDDPEALLKRTKAKLKKVSALESEDNHIRRSLTPEFEGMADRTLHEFSAPTTAISIFKHTQINPQAYGYRCSFHPEVFQGIVFIHRETMVKEVDSLPSCIY